MSIYLITPERAEDLDTVLEALTGWQVGGAPMQLHPGDVGWFWRFGAEATARALRVWRRGSEDLAVALLDGPGLVRVAIAPDRQQDAELATRVAEDISDPARGIFPAGEAAVETPARAVVRDALRGRGWAQGEPWIALSRDLSPPVEDCGLTIDPVGPAQAETWAEINRSAFGANASGADRWHAMAGGPGFANARCLLGRDRAGTAVAAITVWAAGPGRPGIIEPMGVHRNHRGRGYGRAITLAGAAALREMGASAALVNTASANAGAVGTYRAAGLVPAPPLRDLVRA